MAFTPKLKPTSQNATIIDLDIIIRKETPGETPLWIWIASVIGGLVFLILLVITLAKLGFFKRKIKEELAKQRRETMQMLAIGQDQNFSPSE